jgi:hypothetical protein
VGQPQRARIIGKIWLSVRSGRRSACRRCQKGIFQKTWKVPVIALDVSKGSSHLRGFKSFGVPVGKTERIHHSREGFSVIREIAESLGKETGEMPSVVLESTGVYSACVVRYCQSINLPVYLISPLASAKMRKAEIRPTKTDAIDPSTIAKVFYSRELRRLPIQGGARDSLRDLSRIYGSESRALTELKNEYRRLLDLVWPCLDEAWEDPFSSVPMAIVSKIRPSRDPGGEGESPDSEGDILMVPRVGGQIRVRGGEGQGVLENAYVRRARVIALRRGDKGEGGGDKGQRREARFPEEGDGADRRFDPGVAVPQNGSLLLGHSRPQDPRGDRRRP